MTTKKYPNCLMTTSQQSYKEYTTIFPDTVHYNGYDVPLDSIYFSEEDVDKLLEELKIKKAPGTDNIHPGLLQTYHKEMSKPTFKISLQ